MKSVAIAGGVAFVVAVVATALLTRWFAGRRIGQPIREEGPRGHAAKAGTPTLGGIAIVGGAVLGYGVSHFLIRGIHTRAAPLVLFAVVGAGTVGFFDDWLKVRRRHNLGLNKRAKFGAQVAVALTFGILDERWAHAATSLTFTRYNLPGTDLGELGWLVWAVVVIVATSNAVNLTDGLDGLAAGSACFAFAGFALIAFWQFRHGTIYQLPPALDLSTTAIALAAACLGFLWFNAAPARIIMGDTGALALGAGLGALALQMNVALLLPIVGGLFVIVTLSVIIQVVSFRLFHKRVFRMAPLHHHFELAGWPEFTVIVRFWMLSGLCTVIGIAVFYETSFPPGAVH